MSQYLDNEEVTWHKFHKQWKEEQNKLRSKVRIEDVFKFEIPSHVHVQYKDPMSNLGFVSVTATNNNSNIRNTSVHRLKPQWRPRNANDSNNEHSEHKANAAATSTQQPALRYIGGVDISYTKPGAFEYDKACAGLVIYEYPSMKVVHEETQIVTMQYPYIAGFLAFREVAFLVQLVNKVRKSKPEILPQVLLVDGNGIIHFRRVGLATHLGLIVNIPSIGIAKRLLAVDGLNVEYLQAHFNQKLKRIGEFACIVGYNDEHLGYALRTSTQRQQEVVYVSPGHRISLESALKIVMLCCDEQRRYKLPLPVEKADFVTRKIIRRYQQQHANPYRYNNQYGGGDRGYGDEQMAKHSNRRSANTVNRNRNEYNNGNARMSQGNRVNNGRRRNDGNKAESQQHGYGDDDEKAGYRAAAKQSAPRTVHAHNNRNRHRNDNNNGNARMAPAKPVNKNAKNRNNEKKPSSQQHEKQKRNTQTVTPAASVSKSSQRRKRRKRNQ